MHIFFIHNRYQQTGGEDVSVQREKRVLQEHGHRVTLFEVDNQDIRSNRDKIRVALNVAYSAQYRDAVTLKLAQYRPDIVHIHNFFPVLTPSLYDACRETHIPVIQTLHNYRTICPGALLMRQGAICEICVTHSAYRAGWYRCYKGSFLGTLAVARMVQFHRRRQTWHRNVNRFLALTEFARKKFIQGGFPPEKVSVKPNFIADPFLKNQRVQQRSGALFVGRLSHEKGLVTLMNAWRAIKNLPLRIAGDGPLQERVTAMDSHQAIFLGWQPPESISQEMSQASFLIFPSECYENFPLVLVEAFAHGLPIVAPRLGAMSEIVEDGKTGLLFTSRQTDDLIGKIRWMQNHPEACRQMGENARKVYLDRYTPQQNYAMLFTIYQTVRSQYT